MAATDAIAAAVFARTDPTLTRRVKARVAGAVVDVQQAHLSGITYTVTRDDGVQILDTGMDPGDSATLLAADTVFDALQTGIDGGPQYNFAFQLGGATYLPAAGRVYRLAVAFTLTGGETFDAAWDLSAENPSGVVGLRSLAQLKDALGFTDDTYSPALVDALKRAAAYVKSYCRRDFERQTYTELYDVPADGRVVLRQWPVASVTSVWRDPLRAFGSDTLLTVATDYRLTRAGQTGILQLASGCGRDVGYGGGWNPWFYGDGPSGGETLKVTYLAGYDENSVPADLAGAVVDIAAAMYEDRVLRRTRVAAGGAVKSVRRGQSQVTYMTAPESVATFGTSNGSTGDPYGVASVLDLYREVLVA